MHSIIHSLLQRVVQKQPLGIADITALIPSLVERLPEHVLDILAVARLSASQPSTVFTCGIINAKSGHCKENCSFCAQSSYHASNAPVYPLVSQKVLVRQAETFAMHGIDYMGIVISGTAASTRDFDTLCTIADYISARVPIRLCASFGLLNAEQARALRQAGFSSYHHNLETAESYYPTVCSSHAYALRLETVRNARQAGLRVCSGGIFGLGETWEQRIELAETLQNLGVDSIPVNFLMPIQGTPLEQQPLLHPMEALSIIAVLRLLNPDKDIVICGGRGAVLQEWGNMVFSAGANGIMVGNYLTTKGTELQQDIALLWALGLR